MVRSGKEPHECEEDWQLVRGLLPEGWQDMAWQTGAVRRRRGLCHPERLLRALLAHVADGCSLVETALRVRQAGWGRMSGVGLFKRLRASEQWLRWMAQRLFQRHNAPQMGSISSGGGGGGRRIVAVDATTVQEMGPTGSLWRVHWLVNLQDLQCEHYELTDARGGETLRRIPLRPRDIVLGDRGYSNAPDLAWAVVTCGADVLVRVNPFILPLFCGPERDDGFPLMRRLRSLRRSGQVGHWQAWVQAPAAAKGGRRRQQWLAGRLIVVRLSRTATRRAQRRIRLRAQKRQRRPSQRALELAGYLIVWTTLPRQEYPARGVLRLYRLRWQIELVFKRMKSILGLGHLPKHSDASARAWLHGKLLVVLLLERLWEEAEMRASSRWGVLDPKRRSRWREFRFLLRELVAVLVPRYGLSKTLRHWAEIRRRLANAPRRRPRDFLG